MSYGLDFSDVRYETDHAGNRLKATIPYTMFSALTEFWIAARRAQTAQLEAGTRPGQYKGSLQAAQLPTPDETPAAQPAAAPHFTNRNDRHWHKLVSQLPAEASPEVAPDAPIAVHPPESSTAAEPTSPGARRPIHHFHIGEFVQPPPVEVMERVKAGTYFLLAWREYRGLTKADAAELFGRDAATINWHERGRGLPTARTIEKFAEIYDCPVEQMTPLPGSDTSPFKGEGMQEAVAAPEKARRSVSEPRAPHDTDYPDAVLAHLLAGKSPMLAWRLCRGLTVKALADAYGSTPGNIKQMETHAWLRRGSIDKLCPIFHCKPEQLLRPEGMPASGETAADAASAAAPAVEPAPVSVNRPEPPKPRMRPAASPTPMEAAFMQASVDERPVRVADERRNTRLARMQRELANLGG
jgi:transcriptional regulator with XRE-family HTH domain/DNA-binding Xre family transcriptional regulator